MKRFIVLPMTLISALVFAEVALAQYNTGYNCGPWYGNYWGQLVHMSGNIWWICRSLTQTWWGIYI